MNSASRRFKLVQPADLSAIRRFVEETAVTADPNALADLVLAVNEAVTNVIRHGYKAQPGDVEIVVFCGLDSVTVWLYDNARPFDPTLTPTPDITRPLAERPLGGMGVHMMRTFTDEMHYQRTPDGRNSLLLKKCWSATTNNPQTKE